MSALLDRQDVTTAFEKSMENLERRIKEGQDNPEGFVKHFAKELSLSEDDAINLLLSLRDSAVKQGDLDPMITVAGCLLMGYNLGTRATYKEFPEFRDE